MTKQSQFEPRVRFNWGYHDAQFSAGKLTPDGATRNEEWADSHFDRAYGKGFRAGMADKSAGLYTGNSDAAWKARQ